MPQNYVPIFIFIAIVGTLLPITLLLAKLVAADASLLHPVQPRSEERALVDEEPALPLDPPGEAVEAPVAGHDAVARDDERHGVVAQRRPDRPHCPGAPDLGRDPAVRPPVLGSQARVRWRRQDDGVGAQGCRRVCLCGQGGSGARARRMRQSPH